MMPSATSAGASIAMPVRSANRYSAAELASVRAARGATYVTPIPRAATSRRSASEKPRSPNLVAE
jgi:hypothetical protein